MKAIYVSSHETAGPARLARRPIVEVMSKPVQMVPDHALLDDALAQLVRTGLRHLAVIDDGGRCLGVLSDRAIAATWATDYAALSAKTVAAVLDRDPAIVSVRAAVVDAARLMHANRVDAVAVVDDEGHPVGVVTGSDLVSLLAR
jgi:CBS domain-containing protein